MTTLMSAASDAPRAYTRAPAKLPAPPAFESDAERYAWIATEYHRNKRPGFNNGQLARDLAAAAFGISLAELCGPSRTADISEQRFKIACVIRVLSRVTLKKVGKLINRSESQTHEYIETHEAEVAAGLKGGSR